MAKVQKINMDAENLLTANAKAIDKAFKDAALAALLKHRQANSRIAVLYKGKVALLSADEILSGKKSGEK